MLQVVKTFVGHTSAVSSAIFNPYGNLVVTASKDSTIRFWDIVSGACINTFSRQLGEVTSVQISTDGSMLLSGSKDNSNRLWDVRMLKPIRKYKGHSNTTKSFIRLTCCVLCDVLDCELLFVPVLSRPEKQSVGKYLTHYIHPHAPA